MLGLEHHIKEIKTEIQFYKDHSRYAAPELSNFFQAALCNLQAILFILMKMHTNQIVTKQEYLRLLRIETLAKCNDIKNYKYIKGKLSTLEDNINKIKHYIGSYKTSAHTPGLNINNKQQEKFMLLQDILFILMKVHSKQSISKQEHDKLLKIPALKECPAVIIYPYLTETITKDHHQHTNLNFDNKNPLNTTPPLKTELLLRL